MGVRIAYGQRKNINKAIDNLTIPKNSIIITKDEADSELLFYDSTGNLKIIAERTRFESLDEAEQWVKTYPCVGFIIAVRDGATWKPYIVNDDNSLASIESSSGDVPDITIIDGGTSRD